MLSGADLIMIERTRQVNDKGWTPEKDDLQIEDELVECSTYILEDYLAGVDNAPVPAIDSWPLQRAAHVRNKYGPDHIRRLTIAGALIAAEIDRLQRLNAKENP